MNVRLPTRRDASIPKRTRPERDFDWWGAVAGRRYGTAKKGGQEYAVDTAPADLDAFTPQAGEILVSVGHVEMIDGSAWPSTTYHRGFPVASGTYARLTARRRRRQPETDKLRTWDRLAALPLMQRREPLRMATGPAASPLDRMVDLPAVSTQEQEALAGAVDLVQRNERRRLIAGGGNEPPERSVAGIIAWLTERGIELSLARGRLVARSKTPLRADLADLLDQAEELIAAHLQGWPVMCSSCAEPAVTLVLPRAPMCDRHAQ